MIAGILIVLVLGTGMLIAYTLRFQRATLAFGKMLAPETSLLPTGLQDALTPKVQTLRSVLSGISILILLIYGMIFYVWYLGVVFAVVTFFVISPILIQFLPKVGSDFYKQRIRKDLVKRQVKYQQAGDTIREEAIATIVRSLDEEEPINMDSEILKKGMIEWLEGRKK